VTSKAKVISVTYFSVVYVVQYLSKWLGSASVQRVHVTSRNSGGDGELVRDL
jgi:hypothetical protein